jgi:hypothetical protein
MPIFVPLISLSSQKMNTLTLDKPKRKSQKQRVVLNVASRKYDFLME